jgi:hypothetical protein
MPTSSHPSATPVNDFLVLLLDLLLLSMPPKHHSPPAPPCLPSTPPATRAFLPYCSPRPHRSPPSHSDPSTWRSAPNLFHLPWYLPAWPGTPPPPSLSSLSACLSCGCSSRRRRRCLSVRWQSSRLSSFGWLRRGGRARRCVGRATRRLGGCRFRCLGVRSRCMCLCL